MVRRFKVLACVLALVTVGVGGWVFTNAAKPQNPGARVVPTAMPSGPNVLLISLDDTRPDHLGCYGYRVRETSPNLDRFSTQCIRFNRAYTPATYTLPAHMSVFTSMTPTDHGVMEYRSALAEKIPTLPQLLQAAGYNTAALVNNGSLEAQWGFDRGFGLWREFQFFTPQGNCETITNAALQWLNEGPKKPFFLFLHYYDSHLPYDAPSDLRAAFGASLSATEKQLAVFRNLRPDDSLTDATLAELRAAYDACIKWQDREIGRLLNAVPSNTLVILFSDHGESFKEHGWAFHGSTLYEEETRVVLMVKPPLSEGQPSPGAVADEPVTLMDLAPTILAYADGAAPRHFAGVNLRPVIDGGSLPSRVLSAETKAYFTGRMLRSLTDEKLRLIYSMVDGRQEIYRLPDEETDLAAAPPEEAADLGALMKRWVTAAGEEDHWAVYARGAHNFDITVVATNGSFVYAMPTGANIGRPGDSLESRPDNRAVRWRTRGSDNPSALIFRLAGAKDPVQIDAWSDGRRVPQLWVGPSRKPVTTMPAEITTHEDAFSPWIEYPFRPAEDGVYVLRYRATGPAETSPTGVRELDDATMRRLRSLGYIQ